MEKIAQANQAENEDNPILYEPLPEHISLEDTELEPVPKIIMSEDPSPDKGILISPGFRDPGYLLEADKLSSNLKRKSVSFADGVKPGEGTSPSGGEEHPVSPPPATKKTPKKKKKRKVKVRIIRLDGHAKIEEEEDSPPPPPPPDSPPPEAYYSYGGPGFVYQQQLTALAAAVEGQVLAPIPNYASNNSVTFVPPLPPSAPMNDPSQR